MRCMSGSSARESPSGPSILNRWVVGEASLAPAVDVLGLPGAGQSRLWLSEVVESGLFEFFAQFAAAVDGTTQFPMTGGNNDVLGLSAGTYLPLSHLGQLDADYFVYNSCTSRPARSPSSPSGSAGSGPHPRPGTASSGSTAGGGPGSAATRRRRRLGSARLAPTSCGTLTPPSSACSTGPAPIATP